MTNLARGHGPARGWSCHSPGSLIRGRRYWWSVFRGTAGVCDDGNFQIGVVDSAGLLHLHDGGPWGKPAIIRCQRSRFGVLYGSPSSCRPARKNRGYHNAEGELNDHGSCRRLMVR